MMIWILHWTLGGSGIYTVPRKKAKRKLAKGLRFFQAPSFSDDIPFPLTGDIDKLPLEDEKTYRDDSDAVSTIEERLISPKNATLARPHSYLQTIRWAKSKFPKSNS